MQQPPAVGCNPKRSIPADRQGANVVVRHRRCVEPRVDDKADTVESSEPAGRTDPKIAIGRLGERANPAFRKAVLCSPGPADVFGKGWAIRRDRKSTRLNSSHIPLS